MEHINLMATEQIEIEFAEELQELVAIQQEMQLLVQQLGPQVQQNPDFMQFQQKVQSIQVVMEARKAQLIAEFMQDYAKAEKEVLNQVENDPVLKLKDRDLDLIAREEQRKEEE